MAEANFEMGDLVSVRVYGTNLALYGKVNTGYLDQWQGGGINVAWR